MSLLRTIVISAVLAGHSVPSVAAGQDKAFERASAAVRARMAAIDILQGYIPGRAIIAVRAGGPAVVDVKGMTRLTSGRPATEETPFYIASMTKAFVGLMAVRLDANATLPLDTTLAEVFPDMRVAGVDLSKVTMRDALSHRLGFRVPPLNLRTAYTDTVPVASFPAIVSSAAVKIDETFKYDNLGYLLYAAALEARTGRSWRSWIDDLVFDPLGMTHSSARTSDFDGISHLHMRFPDGLHEFAPKSDAIMHAAGGLVISPADMARWLEANVGGKSPIPRRQFAAAQATQVQLDMKEGQLSCTGYSLGWRTCEAMGLTFLEHGGGYTGMRTQMAILPDHGVGFAALFNSDSMTGGLSGQLMLAFLAGYAGKAEELPPPAALAEKYVAMVADLDASRAKDFATERADPKWGGWAWRPAPAQLIELAGRYVNPVMGELRIGVEGEALSGRLNGTGLELEPAARDLFAATLASDYELEALRFHRNAAGEVTGLDYLDRRFERKR
ncbi:MAG TPA: serine hydrolase domain-containing protein [Sphingomicrobium sp.]|nr:serine hydrolase domain-containing protein [Sphingomicrobium sp.]